MRRDRIPNRGLPPDENASEAQINRTHAEIADQSGEMPELDLHGKTREEASLKVKNYIEQMNAAGATSCRIVHGKGTGVLKRLVAEEIKNFTAQGIIATSFQSKKYPEGAIVVVFRP